MGPPPRNRVNLKKLLDDLDCERWPHSHAQEVAGQSFSFGSKKGKKQQQQFASEAASKPTRPASRAEASLPLSAAAHAPRVMTPASLQRQRREHSTPALPQSPKSPLGSSTSSPIRLPPVEKPPPIAVGFKGLGASGKRFGAKGTSAALQSGLRMEMALQSEQRQRQGYEEMRARSSRSLRSRDWGAAEESLSSQIADFGGHRNALLFSSRSFTNLKLGRNSEALRDAEHAATLDPSSTAAHLRRSQSLIRLGPSRAAEAGIALLETLDRTGAGGPVADRWGADALASRAEVRGESGSHDDHALAATGTSSSRPTSSAVDLFGDVLGVIRRQRSFPCLLTRESIETFSTRAAVRKPTGRGLGPRTLRVSTEYDGESSRRLPGPCGPLVLKSIGKNRLHVGWSDASCAPDNADEDAAAGMMGFVLELADASEVGPNQDGGHRFSRGKGLAWQRVYTGHETSFEVGGLSEDTDYALRISARNPEGSGPHSDVLRVTTLLDDFAVLSQTHASLPRGWQQLDRHVADMLDSGYTGVPRKAHWEGVKESLGRYYVEIKGTFKLYCLLGPSATAETGKQSKQELGNGIGMTLPQFQRFVEDCGIARAGAQWHSSDGDERTLIRAVGSSLSRQEVERIFLRANKELEEAIGEAGAHGLPSNEDNPDAQLLEHEFVNTLLRLGKAKYGGLIEPGSEPSPLSSCLERLLDHYVLPAHKFELNDKMAVACRDRMVCSAFEQQPCFAQCTVAYALSAQTTCCCRSARVCYRCAPSSRSMPPRSRLCTRALAQSAPSSSLT